MPRREDAEMPLLTEAAARTVAPAGCAPGGIQSLPVRGSAHSQGLQARGCRQGTVQPGVCTFRPPGRAIHSQGEQKTPLTSPSFPNRLLSDFYTEILTETDFVLSAKESNLTAKQGGKVMESGA